MRNPMPVNKVAVLRAALRGQPVVPGARREVSVDEAAAPFLEAYASRLRAVCFRLIQAAPSWVALEADDLAVLAWEKMLRYLSGPSGESVTGVDPYIDLANSRGTGPAFRSQARVRPSAIGRQVKTGR